MTENEIIIVDGISDVDYNAIVNDSVKYAILSLPFTVNRMSIPNHVQRTLNIAKGKIAEGLFRKFCSLNNIEIDFNTCETPFWTVDHRDFILNHSEWDIKNNFYYCPDGELTDYNYVDLPALIPNRFPGDQWSKRLTKHYPLSTDIVFLFTYLKMASLIGRDRGPDFLEIHLSTSQSEYISNLYSTYDGKPQQAEPFTEDSFWQEMQTRGGMNYFSLNFRPNLVICGYANSAHWVLFKDTGPYERNNYFQNYIQPRWYSKSNNGSLNFMNNTLWAKITNSTVPMSLLPSFLSLYPNLRQSIINARIIT